MYKQVFLPGVGPDVNAGHDEPPIFVERGDAVTVAGVAWAAVVIFLTGRARIDLGAKRRGPDVRNAADPRRWIHTGARLGKNERMRRPVRERRRNDGHAATVSRSEGESYLGDAGRGCERNRGRNRLLEVRAEISRISKIRALSGVEARRQWSGRSGRLWIERGIVGSIGSTRTRIRDEADRWNEDITGGVMEHDVDGRPARRTETGFPLRKPDVRDVPACDRIENGNGEGRGDEPAGRRINGRNYRRLTGSKTDHGPHYESERREH